MDQMIHLTGVVTLAAIAAGGVVFGTTIWAGRFGPPRCYGWMLWGMAAGTLVFLVVILALAVAA